MKKVWIALPIILGLSLDPTLGGQEAQFLEFLEGTWQGQGKLFGTEAEFSQTWSKDLGDSFLRLDYEIRGPMTMDARAYYRQTGADSLGGVWVDSRGEILELTAQITDSAMDTRWRSPTEQGRTVYRRITADSLAVRDYVERGGAWHGFGEARYERQ